EDVQKIVVGNVDRIESIVMRMLGLAKEKPRQKSPVNINDVIETTLPLFNAGKTVIKKNLEPIKKIQGDKEELQEVFINLLQNAVEAMPDGGEIVLRTRVENERIVVEVSDTGKGIPEDLREKIFDPFFSSRHEGTRLGLSIVYRIVREHGGEIKVESQVGKGTAVRMTF
ncbi:MAG: histidine kinase, partial [Candidatus Moranbacteria bacterium]|nr:histidine kinase [Candidatus Moranbacteria bacterium]